jgi:hypothetical protein
MRVVCVCSRRTWLLGSANSEAGNHIWGRRRKARYDRSEKYLDDGGVHIATTTDMTSQVTPHVTQHVTSCQWPCII